MAPDIGKSGNGGRLVRLQVQTTRAWALGTSVLYAAQHLPVRRLVLVVDKVGLACATSQDVSSRMIMLCIGYCALCIKRNARADARAWQGARERVLTHPSRGKVLHTRSRIERALGEYDMPLL